MTTNQRSIQRGCNYLFQYITDHANSNLSLDWDIFSFPAISSKVENVQQMRFHVLEIIWCIVARVPTTRVLHPGFQIQHPRCFVVACSIRLRILARCTDTHWHSRRYKGEAHLNQRDANESLIKYFTVKYPTRIWWVPRCSTTRYVCFGGPIRNDFVVTKYATLDNIKTLSMNDNVMAYQWSSVATSSVDVFVRPSGLNLPLSFAEPSKCFQYASSRRVVRTLRVSVREVSFSSGD